MAALEMEERFNPSQPRDGDGRWTDGGAGGSSPAPEYVGRRRRAGGDGTPATSGGGGMPPELASADVRLSGGGSLTMSRRQDGGTSFDGHGPFSAAQTKKLLDTLSIADDWDPGETETIPGVGTITRQRSGMRVDFDGGGSASVSPRDVTRLEREHERLGRSVRMDTGNGPLDVFPDGKKIAFRHPGKDGTPVEVAFNRSSAQKITRAVDAIIDDIDDPDTPGRAVHTKTVTTNAGKVQVQLTGDWRNGMLTITPADGDDWGVAIDGPQHEDWSDAMGGFLDEASKAPSALTEQVLLTEAAGGAIAKGRRFRARIIAGDVQGSSGYYPASMLKRDAKVFREGLPVFLDHPGATESYDRPERSVRDLAGKLATTAVYERDGLYADIEVYPHWAPVIEAMAGDIGMSIRASGTVEPSQQEGVRGPIVTSLTEATSVDFVTAAGAGGKIVALLESARAQSGGLLRKATEAQPPDTSRWPRLVEAVSDAPWGDVSQSDYSIEQWRKACLIGPEEPSDAKSAYKLPVRMPDGTVNRNAVHAAAARIGQVDAPAGQKKAAARKLVNLYRDELEEDPPASLLSLAGMAQEEARSPHPVDDLDSDMDDDEPDDLDDQDDDPDDEDEQPKAMKEARNVGHWLESRIHRAFTEMADDMFGDGRLTRDERISLSNAIGEGLTAFNRVVAERVPHLYERDLWDDPTPMPAEVSETTATTVPAPPDTSTKEGAPMSEGTKNQGTPPDGGTTEVAESAAQTELNEARRQLAEARLQLATIGENANRATLAEAERDRLKADNDRLRALISAQDRLRQTLAESGLPEVCHARVMSVVCGSEGSNIPLTEAGKVDDERFTGSIAAAIQAEKTYIAGLAESTGTGVPRGLGGSDAIDLSESALSDELENVFAGIGLSADVAKTAAKGRVSF